MTISKLDLEFAAVTWMVNQNIHSLNEQEKSFVETLFTQYCEYSRGSKVAEERVRYLLDVLVGKIHLSEQQVPIAPLEKSLYTEQAVFGMAGPEDQSEEEIDEQQPKQIKRLRQKIQKTELMTDSVQRVPRDATSSQMMTMLTLIAQGQHQGSQMAQANLEQMAQFAEISQANQAAMEVHIHNLQKANAEMQRSLKELYDMQLQKQSLTDLKWHQIPDWFREIYSGGIKRAAVALVKLPFRIASIATDRIIYRPMVRVYDFWAGKLEFVVGHIWWIITIAGVIHIYQITDWETVNNIYTQYGGDYINKYLFSGVDLMKTIPELFPNTKEVANSVNTFFFENCIDPILQTLWVFWQSIVALLTTAANAGLSKLPMANYWFTPANVEWPDTRLFKYAQEFFMKP